MRRVGFFFLFCHLSQKQNTVSLKVCPLGRYGLYVESIFSHCLVGLSVFLALVVTYLYQPLPNPNPTNPAGLEPKYGVLYFYNIIVYCRYKSSNGLFIFCKLCVLTWVYISVVRLLLWPNSSCIYRKSVPASNICVA